jgi:RNA polymerase sigma-70 factor (ECF subfamily)
VIGLSAALLSDPVQAEDAAQEVFLKAYRSLKSYRGASSFSTWLYRLTFNHCADLLRRRGRQKMESMEMEIVSDPGQKEWEAGDTARRLLNSLPEETRTILIL